MACGGEKGAAGRDGVDGTESKFPPLGAETHTAGGVPCTHDGIVVSNPAANDDELEGRRSTGFERGGTHHV